MIRGLFITAIAVVAISLLLLPIFADDSADVATLTWEEFSVIEVDEVEQKLFVFYSPDGSLCILVHTYYAAAMDCQ
jgi:hypothetical protein